MAAAIKIGTIFAGYRTEGVLGRGGMGWCIWPSSPSSAAESRSRSSRRRWRAIPTTRSAFGVSLAWRRRSSIRTPSRFTRRASREDTPYLVMRYVEGEDLSSLIRREGRLDSRRAAAIVDQIAGALDEAHVRGLVHRDIKPAHVLVESRRGTEHGLCLQLLLQRGRLHLADASGRREDRVGQQEACAGHRD